MLRFVVVLFIISSFVVVVGIAAPASGQAINTNVALQPSKGGLIIRQQFRYSEADRKTDAADLDVRLATSATTFVYGATAEFAVIATVPFIMSRRIENNTTGRDFSDSGFGDITVLSKLRLFRNDTGPNDTTRFDLIAGAQVPTGNNEFSRDSVNPIIGGVFTRVSGRHAGSVDLLWHINTGGGNRGADMIRYDGAYSYRLMPREYASENPIALFGLVELNGSYETNGDHELFLSPGIQFVTMRWIIEATVQLPIWQDLDHRAERDFIVGVGFRVQF